MIVALKHNGRLVSIAMAASVLISLCVICTISPSAIEAQGNSANVQAPALVGAPVASAPSACEFDSSNIYLFAKGTDNVLWMKQWTLQSWSAWKSLGGVLTSDPAAVSRRVGVIDVFVRGTDGALWTRATTDGGTSWSNWSKIGGQLLSGTGPAAYAWGDARIGWVVTGTDSKLWHMWRDSAGTHSWQSLGGVLTSSPAAATAPGSKIIDVFVRGRDNGLWWKYYINGWSGWTFIGGM